ncbi:hypothetical protein EDB89DRAFT_2072312 [Lactarius sanguifluus]|nr:hypothetical protein EDB89DRAFT_2072312 [Lactarius sanguifluus]
MSLTALVWASSSIAPSQYICRAAPLKSLPSPLQFPVDLKMDADLQERVEALDEGDGTDNSDDGDDDFDFFS